MTVEKPPKRVRTRPTDNPDAEPDQQPATLDVCRRCALWRDATQPVGGEGASHAPVMLVGEQPGDAEDLQGRPFVGPAGALLDRALDEADIVRSDVYVTNAVKHFEWTARGKRRMHKTPAQREIDACGYWLQKELGAVCPQVVVALGATAVKAVLEDPHARLQDALGKVLDRGAYRLITTYHPSFALRALDPQTRQEVYDEIVAALRAARKLIQSPR